MSEEKEKTQEMIYVVFADIPQTVIDQDGFGNWLKTTGDKIRKDFNTKKVYIHVLGMTVYIISERVKTADIDRVGFGRWFGIRKAELAKYFNTITTAIFIKAI